MENKLPVGGTYFKSSVKKARAALQGRADEILTKYFTMIDMAVAAGDFETANKAFQFLIEHMPREEGAALIDESAAKAKSVDSGPRGPIIQIGVKVGGVSNEPKQLPPPVIIDVKPE